MALRLDLHASLPVLAALAAGALGCSTGAAIETVYTGGCSQGNGDDCWLLGEMWMRKAAWTYHERWDLLVDREKALDAYKKGCELSSLRACTALVERHLLDDHPPQRDAMIAKIHELGGQIRTEQQIDAQDEAILKMVRAGYFTGSMSAASGEGGEQGGGAAGAGKSAAGFGMGMTQDLACTSAKLTAAQLAGCGNPAASINGASCECNKAGVQFSCNTRVTCVP